jgi:hypothetical protein
MKKKNYTLILLILGLTKVYGQEGTVSDPYVSLRQARLVPSSGVYYFDIEGTLFSTYVEDKDGWILIASGNSVTAESSYVTSTALTLQSDAILPKEVYTSVLITEIRMNSTAGIELPFDVQSSDGGVLANLQNDNTLSVNTNSEDWTGVGIERLERSCSSNRGSLSTYIYHACGYRTNMHWQVGKFTEHEKLDYSKSTKNDLNLWVRASVSPLPIKLLEFNAEEDINGFVVLNWQTATERNNDFFTIERSVDGLIFEDIQILKGAGNSLSAMSYSLVDVDPYSGVAYYRLKQTDHDGAFSYSDIVSMEIYQRLAFKVEIYPNPTRSYVTIGCTECLLETVKIYNLFGDDMTSLTSEKSKSEFTRTVDLNNLQNGVYFIKTRNSISKLYKM